MKRNKLFIIVLLVVFVLAACSKDTNKDASKNKEVEQPSENFNETGMPIVQEPITLKFFARKLPTTAKDYNETTLWKEYAEMTNVDIEWEYIPNEGLAEKRNLVLAGNALPDVFYTAYMPNDDLVKYGQQGVFVTLNDLIKKYMPNLTEILEAYPEIKKGITFPDGNIYALPTIYDPEFPSLLIGSKPWIRKSWLEQLDMDMPETTEDFYEYLKGVKETDLNGNGKDDEIPFGATSISDIRMYLAGSFGVNTNGRKHVYIDTDPETNELRFTPTSENYKELLQFLNKLFKEGLIHESIYTIEANQSYALGSEGLYGSTGITNPIAIYGKKVGEDFVGMVPLKGPNGYQKYTDVGSPLAHMGGFVVTNENKHIPETLRWMDHFYSDEGTKMFFMGSEGVTYEEKEDGSVDYLDEIKNNPDGLTLEQALKPHITWLGGGYPGFVKEDYFKGAESLPSSLKASKKIEPYLVDDIWPSFTYTIEESQKRAALAADIEKYVNEMQDKFITGNVPFSEWDKYVETIEKMGLKEYMEIEKKAYDRYKQN